MDNFSLTHLSLVNSKKDILLDIPRDMYPFSVFGFDYLVRRKFGGGRAEWVGGGCVEALAQAGAARLERRVT